MGLVASLVLAPVTGAVAAPPAAAVIRPLPDDSYGLSSYYGPRCQPIRGASVWHLGQDMGAARGTDIRTIAGGAVVKAGSASGFGQVVVIRHSVDDVRVFSVYGHVIDGNRFVQVGDRVRRGQRIAEVGSSGTSTAPHLHLEIWRHQYKGEGWTRDPLTWMRDHGASLTAGAAWARPRTVPSSCTYYTTTRVNLRTGPGTDYRVIRTVAVNRMMTAKPGDGSGSWRRVTQAGTTGWMHADYISPTLTSLGTRYALVDGLRLRSEPSRTGHVLARLPRGTAVKLIWPGSTWSRVLVGGRLGFVLTENIGRSRP